MIKEEKINFFYKKRENMRKQVVFSLDAHLVVTQPRDSQLGFSPNHLFTIPRVGLRFSKPSGFLRFNQPISTKLYYRRII